MLAIPHRGQVSIQDSVGQAKSAEPVIHTSLRPRREFAGGIVDEFFLSFLDDESYAGRA